VILTALAGSGKDAPLPKRRLPGQSRRGRALARHEGPV